MVNRPLPVRGCSLLRTYILREIDTAPLRYSGETNRPLLNCQPCALGQLPAPREVKLSRKRKSGQIRKEHEAWAPDCRRPQGSSDVRQRAANAVCVRARVRSCLFNSSTPPWLATLKLPAFFFRQPIGTQSLILTALLIGALDSRHIGVVFSVFCVCYVFGPALWPRLRACARTCALGLGFHCLSRDRE
ncbi:hypothetical protein CSKR_200188 [Clonorchis sinensis]|uniref:Uncharacterized protein n=1 Tax=Clonorchis sinensis TaxID=79923 RepID=A0A8T1LYP3_CLOSI|nr:hypothetical protein CSKR_200188 [Clonorchis sinensis]